jgi:hypothetical protein
MTAGDYKTAGTGTIPVSGPGVISTVTITNASIAATDRVFITPTSATIDIKGSFNVYLKSVGAGSFVVSVDREQLPTAITFNYHSIATV